MERRPSRVATSPFIRDEEHLEYVFSHDAHSAGIAFVRVKLDASAGIVAAPHLNLPVGAQCSRRTAASHHTLHK